MGVFQNIISFFNTTVIKLNDITLKTALKKLLLIKLLLQYVNKVFKKHVIFKTNIQLK